MCICVFNNSSWFHMHKPPQFTRAWRLSSSGWVVLAIPELWSLGDLHYLRKHKITAFQLEANSKLLYRWVKLLFHLTMQEQSHVSLMSSMHFFLSVTKTNKRNYMHRVSDNSLIPKPNSHNPFTCQLPKQCIEASAGWF